MVENDEKREKRAKGFHMVLKIRTELRKRHIIDTNDIRKGNGRENSCYHEWTEKMLEKQMLRH